MTGTSGEGGRGSGIVVSFSADEGWGLIRTDALPVGDLIWVHYTAVEMTGFRALQVGSAVDVEWESFDQDGYRFRAVRARPQ